MLSKKGKIIFIAAIVICIVGTIGAIYFGFVFFNDRKLILWMFNTYIIGVAGIVVFMVYRYVKIYMT